MFLPLSNFQLIDTNLKWITIILFHRVSDQDLLRIFSSLTIKELALCLYNNSYFSPEWRNKCCFERAREHCRFEPLIVRFPRSSRALPSSRVVCLIKKAIWAQDRLRELHIPAPGACTQWRITAGRGANNVCKF